MRRKRNHASVPTLSNVLKTHSTIRRRNMSSNRFETLKFDVSYDNIQSWILAGLRTMAKDKIGDEDELLKLKLDYPGGYVASDKVIPIEVIRDNDKGVTIRTFG